MTDNIISIGISLKLPATSCSTVFTNLSQSSSSWCWWKVVVIRSNISNIIGYKEYYWQDLEIPSSNELNIFINLFRSDIMKINILEKEKNYLGLTFLFYHGQKHFCLWYSILLDFRSVEWETIYVLLKNIYFALDNEKLISLIEFI